MEIIRVDGSDADVFRRFYAVKFGVRREELEFPAGMGVEEARVVMAREHAEVRADGLGLVDGDAWLGIAWLDWWLVGDTDTVDVELAVAPEYRRRGVATKLLDAAIDRAKAEGRSIVSGTNMAGDPVTGESPGTAFAAARGFVKKHAELHQVAELPLAGLPEHSVDGYEIVASRWLSPTGALDAVHRQEISLRAPTMKNLEIIGAAKAGATASEIVASLRGRSVPTIRPRILAVDGRRVAVLPGDPRWY